MNNKTEDFSWILRYNFIKKAALGALTFGIVVYIFTLPIFIKPLYESEIIVYVPLSIISQQLSQQGMGFASDHEIEWYIQLLKSNMLADSLINHFKMGNNNYKERSKLYKLLESRIQIEKTRYSSVSIKVLDGNPNRAAEMALSVVKLGENIKTNLLYPNRLEAMKYAEDLFEQKASEIANLKNNLDSLNKIIPENHVKKSFIYNQTLNNYNLEFQEFISRKNSYERARKDFDSPLPKAYMISAPILSYKPVWPRRGLLSALGIGGYLFVLIVIEIIRRDVRKDAV